jgi:hypothetical protein
MVQPHSREWYAQIARELGTYQHPWTRHLDGPDPELTYDALLSTFLTPDMWVLEAGCADGKDAARFGPHVAGWVGYDREPGFLDAARRGAPNAAFAIWDGQGEVPGALRGPFHLIVSRRGPTSVIDHLPALAAPGARFLYVGPDALAVHLHRAPVLARDRLDAVGWTVLGEWSLQVRAWLPTEDDDRNRSAFLGEDHDAERWASQAEARGRSYWEERSVLLAAAQ